MLPGAGGGAAVIGVPEPASLGMMGVAAAVAAAGRMRRRVRR
jgi:hypothetical protein